MSSPAVSTPQSKPLIGGHFELGEFINQGGMGAVYRGRDLHTGQTVAIKHLKQEVIGADGGLIERFVREGEALRTLNHPNIVKLLGADKLDTGHYIVMEYVEGGSLAELLARQGKLSVERAVRIGLELSDALARAHYLKIIHRDLKPANILLTEDGTPRLTDFGVAHVGGSDMTGTGVIIGTFAYLPPEVVNGESVDARADIWSFGVLLFEMLTGKRPFDGDSPGAQMAAIMTRPTPDLEALRPDLPIALVDLIYRMLEKDRNHRINSMRIVGAELEAILSGQSTPSARTPTPLVSNNAPTITPTPTRSANNLPTQTTPFIGRESELAELKTLLNDPGVRMVTILGPGGMGKTRLALEAAAQTDFLHGAHFVALAACDTKEQIMNALAEAVKFQFARGTDTPGEQLTEFLREKTMLLVMDNFEHLLMGAGMVETFLENAPGVKLLVTSRERLNIQAETVFRIEGLDIPDPFNVEAAAERSAVKLFLLGARRADPGFKLETENLPNIARICSQVQGLPLGILLAASWVGMLSLKEIGDEIEKSLDFLESEQRDLPTRQRSMRAVFDYSWNLLTPEEQNVFKALAVFRGGFSRESAQEVTGASLRTLMALVNKSLLRRNPSGRYEVHELLRQYAATKLGEEAEESERIHAAHTQHFLNYLSWDKKKMLMKENGNGGKEKHSSKMLRHMTQELDNVLAAWNWAVDHHQYEQLEKVLENFWFFCFITDRSIDGEQAFRHARDTFKMDKPTGLRGALYGQAMAASAFFQSFNGNRKGVRVSMIEADQTLQMCATGRAQAFVPVMRGLLMALTNDLLDDSYTTLQNYCQRAYDTMNREGNAWDRGLASFILSSCERFTGNLDSSQQHAQECATLSQQIDEDGLRSFAELGLALNAWVRGDYIIAKEHFEQTLTTLSHIMPREATAQIKVNLALVVLNLSEFDQAKKYALEAKAYFKEIGSHFGVMRATSALGWNAEARGDQAAAHQYFSEALQVARKIGNPAWIANELANLGRPTVRLEKYADAEKIYREALQIAQTANDDLSVNMAIVWLSYLCGKQGNPAKAVERLGFILTQPNSSELVRDAEAHLAELSFELPSAEYEAALTRGKTCTMESILSEIQ